MVVSAPLERSWLPPRRRAPTSHRAGFGLLVYLVSLLPAALAMREAVLSRRSTLIAAALAAAPMPRYSAPHAETLETEGLQARRARCRTLAVAEMLGVEIRSDEAR